MQTHCHIDQTDRESNRDRQDNKNWNSKIDDGTDTPNQARHANRDCGDDHIKQEPGDNSAEKHHNGTSNEPAFIDLIAPHKGQ